MTGRTRSRPSSSADPRPRDAFARGVVEKTWAKVPAHLLVAPRSALGLPPPPHGRVLLGDAQAAGTRCPGPGACAPAVGGRSGREALAAQHRLDVGLAAPEPIAAAARRGVRRLRWRSAAALAATGSARRGEPPGGERIERAGVTRRGRAAACPAKNSRRFSSARMPIATRVSVVALPRCGSSTTFSMVSSVGRDRGSFSYTSSPGAGDRPRLERRHQRRLVDDVAPRGVDQEGAPAASGPGARRFIRCRVSGVAGSAATRNPLRAAPVELSRGSAPSALASSGVGG